MILPGMDDYLLCVRMCLVQSGFSALLRRRSAVQNIENRHGGNWHVAFFAGPTSESLIAHQSPFPSPDTPPPTTSLGHRARARGFYVSRRVTLPVTIRAACDRDAASRHWVTQCRGWHLMPAPMSKAMVPPPRTSFRYAYSTRTNHRPRCTDNNGQPPQLSKPARQ